MQEQSRRLRLAGRIAAVAFTAVAALGATAGVAHADGDRHGMHGHGMHKDMDPARAAEFIQRRIDRMVPDATADQKTRLAAIFKSGMDEMRPLREKQRATRQQAASLLSQRTIDRSALEQLRAAQMQVHDQLSRRMTQMMADAAEVLTPEQRARVAERMQKRMERRHK